VQAAFWWKLSNTTCYAEGDLHVGREQLMHWIADHAPPNTLLSFLLEEDSPCYQQATDHFHQGFLPIGVDSTIYIVKRTLITVQGTYLLPRGAVDDVVVAAGLGNILLDKLTADSCELRYGDRMSFVRGVIEIVFAPALTMAEEWERDHHWTDWTGGSFSGRDEWDCVWNQPAVEGRWQPSF
jgi:hypothetical protein